MAGLGRSARVPQRRLRTVIWRTLGKLAPCSNCKGTGKVVKIVVRKGKTARDSVDCGACDGTGKQT